ncbi:60S ribosomal protein L21 [Schizosaccharomyces japonicus yFS275]|uniref:60S ribosomal protein L21 n=1 Tax=Schizosaccharomyces japonicus (strain yFS275 / FY16936) TaxID=402676 RepID=B6K013_SCHJY|nr:60S ribosomal protein L21 [Schizosaccharomyces japonicus yFS275]EEB06163.1 60S ribosomal protein L21 [Schizosaccharomyces japonicus yFS275]
MPHSYGIRARTRYLFQRGYREHGQIRLSTYLKTYKIGDIVDIKVNGAVQKGMPHKYYHGKTGVVYNVTQTSVGVLIYKIVGNRYMEKRVNVRIEHVKHSKCRQDFLDRVKANEVKRREARAEGKTVQLRRQAALPVAAHVVSTEGNTPVTLHPVAYDTTI